MTSPRGNATFWYVGLGIVFVASFGLAWLLPVPDLFRGLASIPGVGAMISFLAQLWREQRSHERAVELLHRQQDFALATASHMANIAYDKHVAFCEAYVKRTNQGLQELMRMGPSKDALGFAGDLLGLRIEYTAWLTADIESRLIPFEAALRKMGASESLLPHLPVGERRTRVVDEIYKAFGVIVGTEKPVTDEQAGIATVHILDHLRDVLGIRELTALRQTTTRLALSRVSEQGQAS